MALLRAHPQLQHTHTDLLLFDMTILRLLSTAAIVACVAELPTIVLGSHLRGTHFSSGRNLATINDSSGVHYDYDQAACFTALEINSSGWCARLRDPVTAALYRDEREKGWCEFYKDELACLPNECTGSPLEKEAQHRAEISCGRADSQANVLIHHKKTTSTINPRLHKSRYLGVLHGVRT